MLVVELGPGAEAMAASDQPIARAGGEAVIGQRQPTVARQRLAIGADIGGVHLKAIAHFQRAAAGLDLKITVVIQAPAIYRQCLQLGFLMGGEVDPGLRGVGLGHPQRAAGKTRNEQGEGDTAHAKLRLENQEGAGALGIAIRRPASVGCVVRTRRHPVQHPVYPMPKLNAALIDRTSLGWVPLLLAVGLNGCSTYYGQLAVGQLEVLRQRQPMEAIIADPAQDSALRGRLAQVLHARTFASQALALPDNHSYRLYADVQRPYVVWNLFATEEFSVAPREHCFPIAGCVAYRGYYRQGAARAAAARLQAEGLDTHVAGVEAYSTLGWFDDPLLNTMLRRNDEQLAGLIFHELAHQQLYLPGDTAFNESYASFVEREGLRQWRISRGLPEQDEHSQRRYRQLVELLLATRERLAELYALQRPEAELRQLKQAEFMRLRQAYRTLRDGAWNGDRRFDRWFAQPLNNASLLPFGLYDRWVPAFSALFEQNGRDWPRFHAAVQALARRPADERESRLRQLAD